jgi:hypothetical protein
MPSDNSRSLLPPFGVLGPLLLSVAYEVGGVVLAVALYVLGFIFGAVADGINHTDVPGSGLFAILFGSSGTGLKVGCAVVLGLSLLGFLVSIAAYRGKGWTRPTLGAGFLLAMLLKTYLAAVVAEGGEAVGLAASIALDLGAIYGLARNAEYFSVRR